MKASLLFLLCLVLITINVFAQTIPYNFDKKPIPNSRDWAKILPKRIGEYIQTKLELKEYNCLFSTEYTKGGTKVELWGYIWHQGATCYDGTSMMAMGCTYESGNNYKFELCPDAVTFSYNKGNYTTKYYISVITKSRSELNDFMNIFPY